VQALQAAIDDPARTTVCLPRGKVYQLDQPVYVRVAITRIIGTGSTFNTASSGQFTIDDGSAPAVLLQNIFPGSEFIPLTKRTSRTLIIETAGFNLSKGGIHLNALDSSGFNRESLYGVGRG